MADPVPPLLNSGVLLRDPATVRCRVFGFLGPLTACFRPRNDEFHELLDRDFGW